MQHLLVQIYRIYNNYLHDWLKSKHNVECFSAKPVLPKNYEEDTWKKLEEAVSAIHRQAIN